MKAYNVFGTLHHQSNCIHIVLYCILKRKMAQSVRIFRFLINFYHCYCLYYCSSRDHTRSMQRFDHNILHNTLICLNNICTKKVYTMNISQMILPAKS